MSDTQYLRKVAFKIGNNTDAIDLSAFHFKFQVRRGDIQTPNSIDLRVYNVSDQTVNRIQKEFTKITLQAGYTGNFGLIFYGNIKQIRRGRESATDTFLDITAADGDSAYNFAVVNKSLAAGSSIADRAAAVQQSMSTFGVTPGYVSGLPAATLPRGKVMFGMARDHARILAKTANADWSMQDGQFTIIPQSSYLPGEIPVLTSDTGMIGLPEQTQDGISIKTLLNPNIKIGSRVKVDNASIQRFKFGLGINAIKTNAFVPRIQDDGVYRVLVAEHSGDNRGQDWYTSLVCIGTAAAIPPSQLQRLSVGPA